MLSSPSVMSKIENNEALFVSLLSPMLSFISHHFFPCRTLFSLVILRSLTLSLVHNLSHLLKFLICLTRNSGTLYCLLKQYIFTELNNRYWLMRLLFSFFKLFLLLQQLYIAHSVFYSTIQSHTVMDTDQNLQFSTWIMIYICQSWTLGPWSQMYKF